MTQTTFLNETACRNAEKRLSDFARIGGIEDINIILVSPEQCEHAASQFKIKGDAGGEYFSNIIKFPHFSNNEIDAILENI